LQHGPGPLLHREAAPAPFGVINLPMKPSRLLLSGALLLGACNPYDRATPLVGAPPPEDCKECTARMVLAPMQGGMPQGPQGARPPRAVLNPGTSVFAPPSVTAAFPSGPAVRKVDVPSHAPTLGPAAAPVTVVLFTSYLCTHCTDVAATLKKLVEAHPDKVRGAIRMAPIPGNSSARLAAEAALLAQEQGKFWEMNARLTAGTFKELTVSDVERLAREVGLDVSRFKAALNNHRLEPAVEQDTAQLGGTGRPVYFVNGRMLPGEQKLEVLSSVVEQELQRAEALGAEGLSPAEVGEKLQQQNLASPPELPEPRATALAPVPAPLDASTLQRVAAASVPTRGEARAPVTLVLFSNFASPYAKNVAATLQKVQTFYGPNVRLVYRTLLLDGLEEGRAAARAALAAHQQGRFWEMHDLLFSSSALDRDALLRHARELKLVEERFRADMESDKVEAALQVDQAEALALGVRALPTVFVNDEPLLGDQALDSYKALIDHKLGEGMKKPAEPKKDGKKK